MTFNLTPQATTHSFGLHTAAIQFEEFEVACKCHMAPVVLKALVSG
jgi:hypothetical protein